MNVALKILERIALDALKNQDPGKPEIKLETDLILHGDDRINDPDMKLVLKLHAEAEPYYKN